MSAATELLRDAKQAFAAGDLDKAASLFEQAHLADAKSPDGAIGMAGIALALKQYEDALTILEKTLKHFPKNAEAMTYRGLVDEGFQRLPAAIQSYEKAIKLDPKLALAHYNLGRAYGQQKRWKEAIRELQLATRQEPNNVQFWYAFGIVYQESGDGGHAIEAFSECIERDPLFEDGYNTLADVLIMNGRTDLAEQLLEKGVVLFPESGNFHAQLAAIAIRLKDFPKAVEHLRNQGRVDPGNEQAWLNLSVFGMLAKDLQAAEEGALKATEANPAGWRGFFNLGMVYDAVGLKDQAREAHRKAIANGADEWKPYNNLALNLLESTEPGLWREAAKALEKALELCTVDEAYIPLYNLALAYWNLGEKGKSKAAAETSVETGPPGDETVETARKFLGNFE